MAQRHEPPISHDALFETLLRQGCSAEKAARIAHVDMQRVALDEAEPAQRGFIGGAALSKEELVETLRKG